MKLINTYVEHTICNKMKEAIADGAISKGSSFGVYIQLRGKRVRFNYCPFCNGDISMLGVKIK